MRGDVRMCKYGCGRLASRRARGSLQCEACSRTRTRNGPCAECDGPRYGPEKWCPRCGPYKPSRPLFPGELLVVLVAPDGREREVIRRPGEQIPGGQVCSHALIERTGGVVVVDVGAQSWLVARCGYYTVPPEPPTPRPDRARRFEHNGRCLTLAEWSEVTGISYATLRGRLASGWSLEDTLTVPLQAGLGRPRGYVPRGRCLSSPSVGNRSA